MKKLELIYVQDPLCGWCYALDSAVRFVADSLPSGVSMTVLNLGLFAESNIKVMNASFQGHLERGTRQVESVSDSRFSDKFFKNIVANTSYVYESVTAGIGILALHKLTDASILSLTSALQKRFFVGGQSASSLETYAALGTTFGADPMDFSKLFFAPNIRTEFEEERKRSRTLLEKVGTRAVPALIINDGERLLLVKHEEHRKPEDLLRHILEMMGRAND